MAYLGTKPQSGFISQEANQYFTGLTQNYIDLNQSISSLSSVIVLVNGVVQENSTMSLTSSTRITLGDTLVSGDKVTCIYVAKISSTQAPGTGTVTNDMLAGSIANSKLANSSITLNGSAVSLGGSATVGGDATPKFFVKKNADQTGITDHAITLVTFQTEEIDSDNAFASNKFTVPSGEGGLYFIGFNFVGARDNQTKNVRGQIFLNGSIKRASQLDLNSSPNGYAMPLHLTTIIELSAGDYIEFYASVDSQDSGTVNFHQSNSGGDATYAYGYKIA
jgi:hypothetical protein